MKKRWVAGRVYEDVVRFLEDIGEYSAASALSRKLDPDTDERFAQSLESGDTNAAEQWRLAHSDSGLYLRRLAELRARNVDLVRRIDAVQSALARTRRWEESYEWRIATDGTDSIEVLPGRGFRAVATHHGTFVAESASFAETYEALDVLSNLQKDLFYAIGWASWADRGQMTYDDPERTRAETEERYAYLYRLSREARSDGIELADVVGAALSERGTFADETTYGEVSVERSFRRGSRPSYDDEPDIAVIEFDVRSRSLTMSAESPGVERTVEFAGVYTRLQNDLRRVLGWAWL